jgi:hypothetical protein
MRTVLLAVFGVQVFAAICLAAGNNTGRNTNEKKEGDALVSIDGRCILVFMKSPRMGSALIIEHAEIKRIGKVSFLRGKMHNCTPGASLWNKCMVFVPVDDILACFEFETLEEARSAGAEVIKLQQQEQKALPKSATPSGPTVERGFPNNE